MTVVVTGASGHVGGNLVRALLDAGRSVRAVVRDDTRAIDGLDLEPVRADVRDPASLREAFRGAEVVYHLAAQIAIAGEPEAQVRQVNVEGARNVAEACLEAGVRRLVHFSSIHALSHLPEDATIDESRVPAHGDELPVYDRTKAAGERAVRSVIDRGLDAVVINPTSVLGRHDYKPSAMGRILLAIYRRRLPALVDGGFNWVDVRDVVQGAMAAEQRGRCGERYLLSGHWRSVKELGQAVGSVTGRRVPRLVCPMWLARVGAPLSLTASRLVGHQALFTPDSLRALRCHRWITSAKSEQELGYRARPLEETVADAFEWFARAGMI